MEKYLYLLFCIFFITSCQQIDNSSFPASFSLSFPGKYHLCQTYNDCGPYSVMAVINIFSDGSVSAEQMKKEMKWRLKNNYTLPFGLESLLRKYRIKISTHILSGKTKAEKIDFLKFHISRGRPVILLGKIQDTPILHYLTVLGYNNNNFFCYDSFQKKEKGTRYTIDGNGKQTGNRTFSHDALLEFWDKGGYSVFYRNYCIVAYGEKEKREGKMKGRSSKRNDRL